MKRALVALLLAAPVGAQDSAHVRAQRPRLDSVAASLARYCAGATSASYVCRAPTSATAVLARARAAEALPGASVPPTPVPAPPPTPTPAPTTSGVCAHEPIGATRIQDQPWLTAPVRNVATSQGWIDDGGNGASAFSIVTDSTSPFPDHRVIAGLFRQGSPGGSGPFYVYRPFSVSEQFRTLYICVAVKHDAAFDNTNGNAGTKFLWPAGDQVGGALTYTSHDGAAMDFQMIQQGPVDRQLRGNLAPATVVNRRGQWTVYELLLKANTNNATANGALDIWLDGVHTHQYRDVQWQMGGSRTWQSLAWNPTYGGGPHPVPHDQYQSLDHVRISGVP